MFSCNVRQTLKSEGFREQPYIGKGPAIPLEYITCNCLLVEAGNAQYCDEHFCN